MFGFNKRREERYRKEEEGIKFIDIPGSWIFISHSNKDWEKVKIVRDYLENYGHKPLMFFLKCLETDTELNELILREIEARNWFILCESENSRNSKWVQAEADYIKQFEDKVYETINLDNPKGLKKEFYKLEKLSKRLTTYLSHCKEDNEIADVFINKLIENEFRFNLKVSTFTELKYRTIREMNMKKFYNIFPVDPILEAVKNGYFILLITENLLKLEHSLTYYETLKAIKKKSYRNNIIPILFVSMDKLQYSKFPASLFTLPMIDFTDGLLEDNVNKLILDLKTRKMD